MRQNFPTCFYCFNSSVILQTYLHEKSSRHFYVQFSGKNDLHTQWKLAHTLPDGLLTTLTFRQANKIGHRKLIQKYRRGYSCH